MENDRDPLDIIAAEINQCRLRQGCGHPPCGKHAVGKPTHQQRRKSSILVVGEAPGPDSWWRTHRAFHRLTASGDISLSRTGVNLDHCLAVLGTSISRVNFVEAVRCRPDAPQPWHPIERVRRRCRPFLHAHLLATQPRLVLPLGVVATASCLEVTLGQRPGRFAAVAGMISEWSAPWGACWILPLYHPSPANGGRWPQNIAFLQHFLETHPGFRTTVTRCGSWRTSARILEILYEVRHTRSYCDADLDQSG
jgi:uracil-DNA glycosylase family 4